MSETPNNGTYGPNPEVAATSHVGSMEEYERLYRLSIDDPETFFSYTSYDTPTTINRLDVATGEVTLFRQPDVDFDSDDYVVKQVFYASNDGTRVPMFIAHHVDVELDGNAPTMLYGYGGFEVSQRPRYSATTGKAWVGRGGVYALANIRGGGEFGPRWHQAALKDNRHKAYEDFDAVAEVEVPLKKGENRIEVFFDDLAERDTRFYVQLDYLEGPAARQAIEAREAIGIGKDIIRC